MDCINEVYLMGRLGQDPVPNDRGSVLKLRIATNNREKGADGTWGDAVQWHSVTLLGEKNVKRMSDILKKGDVVWAKGSLRYDSYQKDGVTKYFTEILSFEIGIVSCAALGKARVPGEVPAKGGNDPDGLFG